MFDHIMSLRLSEGVWCLMNRYVIVVFFFKQKTAYEMRISDWSSDVCSSDLPVQLGGIAFEPQRRSVAQFAAPLGDAERQPVRAPRRVGVIAFVHRRRSVERRVGKECVSTRRSRW